MKYNFKEFTSCLKVFIEFQKEWDSEEWNQQYINFKFWLDNIRQEYKDRHDAFQLYHEFAFEFYPGATHETHYYCLNQRK